MKTRPAILSAVSLAAVMSAAHLAYASSSQADIAVQSDLSHMSVSVSQGAGGGCLGGFTFQGAWGGCVRESVDTHTESLACPDGSNGLQSRQRSRMRYSHQNGSVRHGAYGAWSAWSGECAPASGADPAPTPEPPGAGPGIPKVGDTYFVDAWICDGTNSHYPFPAGPSNSSRNTLISTYKSFNFYGRCPEREGYRYWIEQWTLAAQAHASQYGIPLNVAYDATFGLPGTGIKSRMLDRAIANGERKPEIIGSMDAECQLVADMTYGAGRLTAVYDTAGNGSRCKVVRVH